MRHVSAAFAWIERETPAGPQWLSQWNRKWQAFNLVGGHVEPGETFRECLVREMVEELGIAANQFSVDPDRLTRIEFEAFFVPAQETTPYQMDLFRAEILSEAARQRLDGHPENRWLSRHEINAASTNDGRAISEVTLRFSTAVERNITQ